MLMSSPDLSTVDQSSISERTALTNETNESFDIFTLISTELNTEKDKETLKALCKCSPDLWCHLFHRIYRSVILSNEDQCKTFLYLVQRKLVVPSKVPRICAHMRNTDRSALRDALELFQNSPELNQLEINGSEDGQACPEDLVPTIIQVVSTATKPLTMVFINMVSVPSIYLNYARHLEFRHSYLTHDKPIPVESRQLHVETLACTSDTNQSSFEAMATGGVHFPNLKHLLIKYKPSKRDLEIVDGSLAIVLDSNDSLEEITILYERDESLPLSYTAYAVANLVQVLCMISATRPRDISLHLDFTCDMYHAFDVLSCMDTLEDFRQISIAVPCPAGFSRVLLKYGYHRLVAGGMNCSFRVDRKATEQSSLVVWGSTVKDDTTLAPMSRAKSYYNVCPSLIRPELGRDVFWKDEMISFDDL